MKKTILEPSRETPVLGDWDIVVAGGGTSGSVAAISAARCGVKVLLIEQTGMLGGSATVGLVTPMMDVCMPGNPMCSAISEEINNRMIGSGFGAEENVRHNRGYFDPLMLAVMLEKLCMDAGVEILYHTVICGTIVVQKAVKGILTENKSGRQAILAKCVIDCTGDADVAALAGALFEKGDPQTGKSQPVSLRYNVSGIDIERFTAFLDHLYGGRNYNYHPPIFQLSCVQSRMCPLTPLFQKACDEGILTQNDALYWQAFGVPGCPGCLAFNCPEFLEDTDGTDVSCLTRIQIRGKQSIVRQMNFYKKYFEGFENAYVSQISGMVGVRESRRITGEYCLSEEDILCRAHFEDYISKTNYPVDIHGVKLRNECFAVHGEEIPYYEIPFRCLVPKSIDALLVAGRCVSCTFPIQSSLRVQPTVRAFGEAAGIAAAMAVSGNLLVREINGAEVRKIMMAHGARFE